MVFAGLATSVIAVACFVDTEQTGNEEVGSASEEVIFCNDDWSELQTTASHPYRAVGYLNNGCSAFMIGDDYIVAAAHCFTYDYNGSWQDDAMSGYDGLRFYPNYHPSRGRSNVPRADVGDVVVGTRIRMMSTVRVCDKTT